MRDLSLNRLATVIAAAIALAAGSNSSARADEFPPLNTPASAVHLPGKFVWADLFTSDPEAAAKFYCDLFGWTAASHEKNDRTYLVLSDGDRPVAGIVGRSAGKSKRPARWIPYISVANIGAALIAATNAGGRELAPSRDFPQRGTQAIFADSEGSPVGILQSSSGDPADSEPKPGEWNWFELLAQKPFATVNFYHVTFGYAVTTDTRSDKPAHFLLSSNELARAGVAPIPDQPDAKAGWLGFIRVASIEETSGRVAALGGGVLVAPRPAALGSRSAIISDPTGGAVGLIEYVDNENPANRP